MVFDFLLRWYHGDARRFRVRSFRNKRNPFEINSAVILLLVAEISTIFWKSLWVEVFESSEFLILNHSNVGIESSRSQSNKPTKAFFRNLHSHFNKTKSRHATPCHRHSGFVWFGKHIASLRGKWNLRREDEFLSRVREIKSSVTDAHITRHRRIYFRSKCLSEISYFPRSFHIHSCLTLWAL